MGYTKIAIKGISWIGAARGVTRVISVIRTAIVARILTPADFGFFAIASLVLTLVELLTETGINVVLTQKKNDIDKYVDTAWIVSILRGLIISILILVTAPIIVSFFDSSQAYQLLLLISAVPLIRGFINPSVVKFVKNLEFGKEFSYRVSLFSIESIVTIAWALFSPTAESLVMGLIAGALAEVVISFLVVKPIPKLYFDRNKFLEVINKGKWLTFAGVLNYGYQNGDNIVVGRILGASSLGLYDVAYRFSMMPITEVSDVVGRVTFPVYVKISEDMERLRRAYIKSVLLIIGVALPIGLILVFFPEAVIKLILGEQWIEATQILRVLTIVGVIRAVGFSIMPPLYALGLQKKMSLITLISFAGMITTIVPLVYYFGLLGAAYASLIGTLVTIPYILVLSRKIFIS